MSIGKGYSWPVGLGRVPWNPKFEKLRTIVCINPLLCWAANLGAYNSLNCYFEKPHPFQVNKSGWTDTNSRTRRKLNASTFLSADAGVIVVKAIKGNLWAFLMWKLIYCFYIISIYQNIIMVALVNQTNAKDVMMVKPSPIKDRLIEKDCQIRLFNCWLLGNSILSVWIFFSFNLCTYETVWCFLTMKLLSTYFFQIKNVKFLLAQSLSVWGNWKL